MLRLLPAMYSPQRSRVFYREHAKETVFKEEAPRHGILHVAAHAIVDDRAPMYSAIVLAQSGEASDDGLLEAREVVDLRSVRSSRCFPRVKPRSARSVEAKE